MKISSKSEFFDRWHKGYLGNRPRVWSTVHAILACGYEGPVTLRYRGHAGGGMAVTHIPADKVAKKVAEWVAHGVESELITFHESMPDDDLLIQGEVVRNVGGLDLTYSLKAGLSMRDAMRHAQTASGLRAHLILDEFLDANSRDDLSILLELYPDAVVEFGTYGRAVGMLPRRNTVIWEVRDY